MNLEIDTQMTPDKIPIVHLKGEIDLHTCSALRDTLRDLEAQARAVNAAVDDPCSGKVSSVPQAAPPVCGSASKVSGP